MNRNYCMVDKIYSAHRPIVKEIPFKIKDFTITAFEVPHDGSDNVGFFISYGNLYFAFATDLGHITPTADKYLRQANYLVIESNYDEAMLRNGSYPLHLQRRILADSGHMDNARTAEYLARIYTPALRNIFYVISAGITITLNWLIRRWKTDFTRKAYEWVKMWSWWHLPVITHRSFIRLKSRKEWIGKVRFREKMIVLDSRIVCRSVKIVVARNF